MCVCIYTVFQCERALERSVGHHCMSTLLRYMSMLSRGLVCQQLYAFMCFGEVAFEGGLKWGVVFFWVGYFSKVTHLSFKLLIATLLVKSWQWFQWTKNIQLVQSGCLCSLLRLKPTQHFVHFANLPFCPKNLPEIISALSIQLSFQTTTRVLVY